MRRTPALGFPRADDGARTHDPQLGKPTSPRMNRRVSLNYAKRPPLGTAWFRSVGVTSGAQLAQITPHETPGG
jgi:hypothetical protein